jgi:hypothetical protein
VKSQTCACARSRPEAGCDVRRRRPPSSPELSTSRTFSRSETNAVADLHDRALVLSGGSPSFDARHRHQILLDFQLHGHDRFLSKFREIFSEVRHLVDIPNLAIKDLSMYVQLDADGNGVLDEAEFRKVSRVHSRMVAQSWARDSPPRLQLVQVMDPAKGDKEIVALLEAIDPFNNQQITYSEVS